MSRTSKAWEALQDRLSQAAETVTRSPRVDIVSGGVDEIDPPEDIDEYAELVKNTGIVRANLRKFVNDVWEPGYRVEGPDETVQYFEGEKEDIDAPAPEDTPEGGFLSQAAVYGGEKHQEFYDFGKEATYQRWVRGTVLVEYLKADRTDSESPITGFHFIRPETVYPRVENNTNILLPPDKEDLPSDISVSDVDLTPRDEVAAYVQFDDESVLGLRNNGFDKQDIPLSQNDVLKQTLEPDIGGDIGTAEGVFGTSVIEAINEDIEEYKRIKRDRAEAIGRKAYGIWTAQFTKETYEFGNTTEVVEWGDDAIKDTEKDLQDLGPGDVLSSDAGIDLERFDGEVPELEPTLMHYVDDIMSALPAPKYLTGFSNDINRDVASDQESGYHDLVSEERNVQEESWTTAIREVATRKGLDTEGLEFKIQPKQEDNPVKSLSTEEIDRMNTYVSTLNQAAGPQAGPTALVDGQEILEVMDFPVKDMDAPEDVAAEMADSEAAKEAWEDIMGLEALQGNEPFADVPVVPTGIDTLTNAWLIRWAEWVAAGKPEIPKEEALGWNPALHPRDPETGQFVERPFNLPDDMPDFESMGAKGTLSYLDEQGEDVSGILDPESGVTIDGVPNDATSIDDIPSDSGSGVPSFESRDEALSAIDESPVSIDEGESELNDEQAKALGGAVAALQESDATDLQELQEYTSQGRTKGQFDLFRIDRNEMSSSAGQYRDQYGFINYNARNWEDNEDFQEFLVNDGDMVENIAIHEMGHALHGLGLDKSNREFSDIRDTEIPSDVLESEISTYAAQNASEAVAEMFVHQARGNELPSELQALYDELNGPEPPTL